ncbi:MAG: hypothetical protein R3E44_03135 [Paracoccaceae bacterium]
MPSTIVACDEYFLRNERNAVEVKAPLDADALVEDLFKLESAGTIELAPDETVLGPRGERQADAIPGNVKIGKSIRRKIPYLLSHEPAQPIRHMRLPTDGRLLRRQIHDLHHRKLPFATLITQGTPSSMRNHVEKVTRFALDWP